MRFGIDLGGTKTEIIALNNDNVLCYRKRIASPRGSYQATVEMLCALVWEAETILGEKGSVGIGIPGCMSPATHRVKNANSTWLIGQPLQQDLSRELGREVRIANDADCFTLSESCDGSGEDYYCVFGVILGTGTGGGLVMGKRNWVGPNAITGEWGHNPLPWPTEQDVALECYCGKKGCIETFLSGPGLQRHYRLLGGDEHHQPEDIIALRTSNTLANQAYQNWLDRLARGLASVINVIDPDVIVLGGGLSNISSLYDDLPSRMAPYVFSDTLVTPVLAARHGDASGVRGAAWLWPE